VRELSLFSGAGGGLLGSKILGWETVGYVEYEPYCQKVIRQRIADGILDAAPIFGDIRKFLSEGYADAYQGMVDIVTGGFPCQPFSVAGEGLAENDPRNMWPETIGVIRTIRPSFALLENVTGLFNHKYIRRIFGELAEGGYDARWCALSGYSIGAPVKGERAFILAAANGINGKTWLGPLEDRAGALQQRPDFKMLREVWLQAINKNAGKHNGVADYMERGRAVGNGQIPLLLAFAYEILSRGVVEMTPGGEGIE